MYMHTEVKKFCGQTAGGILKTASIGKSCAGFVHVWVTARNRGVYQVMMNDYGEMVMSDSGETITMPISDRAREKLEKLLKQADDLMLADD